MAPGSASLGLPQGIGKLLLNETLLHDPDPAAKKAGIDKN
jgi:hypothetical protein